MQVPVAKVDTLRLSRVARRNLESGPDEPENEAASPGEAPDDVWLRTADAELDFAEGATEGAGALRECIAAPASLLRLSSGVLSGNQCHYSLGDHIQALAVLTGGPLHPISRVLTYGLLPALPRMSCDGKAIRWL